jgi:hypothetical protein
MDRRRAPRLLALAAVVAAGALAATAGAVPNSRLPPDLRRLLGAERHLRLGGFVISQSVVGGRDGRPRLLSRIAERGRLAPPGYAITSSVGGRPVFLRYVGTYAYGTAPGLSRLDGGHKWVRVRLRDLAGGRANVQGLIHGYLTNLADVVLPPATSVQEIGPATVSGRPVTEFVAATAAPASTTRIFLAADGLPVRTIETVRTQVTTTDISLTLPVVVKVPPASETVDEARLTAAEQERVNNVLASPPGLQ